MPLLQELVANLGGGAVVRKRLEGRNHLVVPTVMILEGVHEGSQGPLYYGPDDMRESVTLWDHKPVALFHPKDGNGKPVSACSPTALERHKLGVILNTKFEDTTPPRLAAESWLDEGRLKALAPEVHAAVLRGDVVEVSTGLFTDNEETPGDWNGEKYDAVARNFKPDHLAILPGMKGACSVQDGAGLGVNEANPGKALTVVREFVLNNRPTVNELSQEQKSSRLWSAVREKFGDGAWPEETFTSYLIYRSKDGDLYKVSYHFKDDEAVIDDDSVKVERDVRYKPVTSGVNNEGLGDESDMKTKQQKVDALLANAKSGFKEDARASLMALPDATLDTIVANTDKATAEPAPVQPGTPAAQATTEGGKPVGGVSAEDAAARVQKEKEATQNQKISLEQLPEEVQKIVANAQSVLGLVENAKQIVENERQRLITAITANSQQFTEDELKATDVKVLHQIHRAVTENATRDFGIPAGYGDPAPGLVGTDPDGGIIVANADEEGLDLPSTKPTAAAE
jgi:hypothetical protein